MTLDQLKRIIGLCVVLGVVGASASEETHQLSSSPSKSLLAVSTVVIAVGLAAVSVFAMACCGFFKRKSKANDDDPETTTAETGNSRNATVRNDIRLNQQSGPVAGVAAQSAPQTTSFNVQSDFVRESNGPQRTMNVGPLPVTVTVEPAAVAQETQGGFKDRSNSLASLGTFANQAVEAVTLFSKDEHGIGLSVNAERASDGIFIRDVHPDGPAAESRKLNSGDRIISMAICMEKMTLDHAQTLFQLARFYPVELHFVKCPPEAAVHLHVPEGAGSPTGDPLEERGRSQSASCLPSIIEDDHEQTKLHQDRSSSSLTHLPLPGQISRWRNEAELSPEIKIENNRPGFDEDILTLSDLASVKFSGDKDDEEELAPYTAQNQVKSVNPLESGKYPGDLEPSAAGAESFAEYENWQNQRAAAYDDSDEEEEGEDRVGGLERKDRVTGNGIHPSGVDSISEPTWQSDFKINLPHLDVDSALEDSRPNAGGSEIAKVNGNGSFEESSTFRNEVVADLHERKEDGDEEMKVGLDLNHHSRWNQSDVETGRLTEDVDTRSTHQNKQDTYKTGGVDFGRDTSKQWNSLYDNAIDEDEKSDEKTTFSISKPRTSEEISWNFNSPDPYIEVERDAGLFHASNPSPTEDHRGALSFGVKAERGKESYNDQGHESSTKEGTSMEGEMSVINTGGVVVDSSDYFGSPVSGRNTDGHGFDNSGEASANWEAVKVSGSQGLRRSPAGDEKQEDKVVRQGQTESYYERFCESVETGLPGRVIDLDVVDEGHEEGTEKEEKKETGLRLEVNKSEQKQDVSVAMASVNGPEFEKRNSVTLVSGDTSPEIATISPSKKSPSSSPVKESKGKSSFGGRLKEFFSPRRGSRDKDRGDVEQTSVRANDFTFTSPQLSPQKQSTVNVVHEAAKSLNEGHDRGFEVAVQPPEVQTQLGVVLSDRGREGKGEEEEVEETWANSYVVNGDNDSGAETNKVQRAFEFSTPGKESVDEDETGADEELVESKERENDYDYPRKLYATNVENGEVAQNGEGASLPPESDEPGFVFDGADFKEFYYGMAFYGKGGDATDGVKDNKTEDLEYKENDRTQPTRTEGEKKANGFEGESLSEDAESLPTVHLHQDPSSDDEDEIITYSPNPQTRLPADSSPPQERILAKEEMRDPSLQRGTDQTLSTSTRPDAFEFMDLSQFSLEPLELPSWESLGSSQQQNGVEGGSTSNGPNANKYKTKEINLMTSEDRNNNTLIESSNA